jgi:hypothetical protein
MCATWCWLMPLMSITAPQKHLDRPLASWVGSLHPESHIAYFHAVQARCFQYLLKSISVRFAKNTRQALSRASRAWSKLAAAPDVIGGDHGGAQGDGFGAIILDIVSRHP